MLEQTLSKMHILKLHGMAEALTEQNQNAIYTELAFNERLA